VPAVVETIAGLRSQLRIAAAEAATASSPQPLVALVPTMGALHDGHLALVQRAQESAAIVVVSIFINPLQFGSSEDLDRYPRTVDTDVECLRAAGVQFVFAPTIADMYPTGPTQTRVVAGDIGAVLEGNSRPGHFDGMLTVVSKLLNIVTPDIVVFGEKDAQQAFLVKRMVADLDIDVVVETVPTIREDDGLALSSRNRFLDGNQRTAATALPRALEAAASSAGAGTDAALSAARSVLEAEPAVELDYLAIVDPETFLAVDAEHRGPALVLVAARVGTTRLIDNHAIHLG
jgi:pantoate--beta-alanine ligase